MAEIVNRVKVGRSTYVQVQGHDESLWWPEGSNYRDGNALDIDEIGAIDRDIVDLRKQMEAIDQEIAGKAAEVALLRELKKSSGYGSATWFGGNR